MSNKDCLYLMYVCSCSERTTRCQDHLALFLDIPSTSHVHPSLQEALSHYMQSDIRELKCGKCGGQHSKVETVFARLPRYDIWMSRVSTQLGVQAVVFSYTS
jgi:hypothetical protein